VNLSDFKGTSACSYSTFRTWSLMEQETAHAPRFYLPELDVLRFFAFLAVFLGHTFNSTAAFNYPGLIAISAVSYRFLETPFLKLKSRFAGPHSHSKTYPEVGG
jgi:peptidoglycan/LPS O-acetylase OafA/YrhL